MIGKCSFYVFILFFISCVKKQDNNIIGRELIKENINCLIDSVELLDPNLLPVSKVSTKDFPKYKPVKSKEIQINLLEKIKTSYRNQKNDSDNYLEFVLLKKELMNFKSRYKFNLVRDNNFDPSIVFVKIENFKIDGINASLEVTKTIGISFVRDKYIFKKIDGHWVMHKKINVGSG